MKLTDILKEIEDEDGKKGMKVNYDPAVKPEPPFTIKDIVDALTDINNYDKTLKTKFALRDGSSDGKESFPKRTNPNELLKLAKEEWVKLSEDGKLRKIKNIKNRIFTQTENGEHMPNYVGKKSWEENIEKNDIVQDAYNDWENEGNEGSIEDYLTSLSFEDLKNTGLLGNKGVNYWPQKPYTKDQEIALNQASMREGENFIVTNNRVIFPLESNKPFLGTQGEQGLRNIVNSILKAANIKTTPSDVVRGTTISSTTQQQPEKPKTEVTPPLSTTVNTADQADKLRKQLQAKLGDVKSAKYEVEPVESPEGRKYKLVVTGITASQRAAIQPLTIDFKRNLKEANEWEMRQMLVRAGIIK